MARRRRCYVPIEYLPDTKCADCFIEVTKPDKSEGYSLQVLKLSLARGQSK